MYTPKLINRIFLLIIGIKGFVLNSENERIPNAHIRIQDRDKVTKTTQYGEYWRLLLPGYYHFEVYLSCQMKQIFNYIIQAFTLTVSAELAHLNRKNNKKTPIFQ